MAPCWTRVLCGVVAGTLFVSSFPGKAKAASCELGATIFKDTFYGVGAGVVIGGLVMLARQDDSHVVSTLATGGLIGAGVGATIGAVEVGMCANSARAAAAKPGWQVPKAVFLDAPAADENRVQGEIAHASHKPFTFQEKHGGFGLSFAYNFK